MGSIVSITTIFIIVAPKMLLRDHNSTVLNVYKHGTGICLQYCCPKEVITQVLDNRNQIDPDTWGVQGNNKKILFGVTGKSSQGTISLCIVKHFIVVWKNKSF